MSMVWKQHSFCRPVMRVFLLCSQQKTVLETVVYSTLAFTPRRFLLYSGICWPPHQMGKCGTRPFLWWVRAQGRSPHVPGTSQKCLRPRRIPPLQHSKTNINWILIIFYQDQNMTLNSLHIKSRDILRSKHI